MGVTVSKALCEHFDHSRQELFDLVRFHRYTTWADVMKGHGRGRGCEICRPTVASILASLSNGYVLGGDQSSLQDTNDHHLANMQRNGTYSVVPRVPGGEITPDQLIALGQIAKDFELYTKITGGQRIDLFGAQLHELPAIWARVIDAGMESGHAYGKALRTVKSCVGSTWCRYGVLDSVGHGHPSGGALSRSAGPAQDQDGRLGLYEGMRRGAEQGRRGHRHRERLESLRRRQRRTGATPRRPLCDRVCPTRN